MELSGNVYLCSAGETFDSVAALLYGDEKYAAELLCANPEQDKKLVFEGGETLYMPLIDQPENDEAAALPEAPPWKE